MLRQQTAPPILRVVGRKPERAVELARAARDTELDLAPLSDAIDVVTDDLVVDETTPVTTHSEWACLVPPPKES